MYVWEELDTVDFELSEELDRDERFPFYPLIDEYCHLFIDTINEHLIRMKDENPLMGDFQLVFEKSTSLEDVEKIPNLLYCYDFHIKSRTKYGDFTSRGYRMSVSVKNPREMSIGVRAKLSTALDEKNSWGGEVIHRRGKAQIFYSYSINATNATVKKSTFVLKEDPLYRIWGRVYLLLTPSNLCIYTHRIAYPCNVLSFLLFRNVLDGDDNLMYANGWRCDGSEITVITPEDQYDYLSVSRVSIAPKVWLRDIYQLGGVDKEIRRFMPDVYLTDEPKLQHCTVVNIQHMNPSTGLFENPNFWIGYINTFATGKRYLLAVK